MKTIKLIEIKKLPLNQDRKYKYVAIFEVDSKIKSTRFGAKGYSDYTIHKDEERRNRYINRHIRDLKTNDPTRAGYLSMYIIWNLPSFEKSVIDYKKRLNTYNKTGIFPLNIKNFPDKIIV